MRVCVLPQAIRKAPTTTAVGFRQTANKFAIVVQLLLGEIPDRATFHDPILRRPLEPYFKLTQGIYTCTYMYLSLLSSLSLSLTAVRNGDLQLFGRTLDRYEAQFQRERTYTLIIRLRHNVIKTGIKMVSISYSRISLEDVAGKLKLDSSVDAEYIVAKVTCPAPS